MAKSILEKSGASYTSVELDLRGDGAAIQQELADLTGQTTVPSVWIGGKFVGGFSELSGLSPEKLTEMLKEAGSL